MNHKNLDIKTNCGCKDTCNSTQNKHKNLKNKGIFGIISAMVICCSAPLIIGLFAGGAVALPAAIWGGDLAIYIDIAVIIAIAGFYILKLKSKL